jgi:translation elongation factor P/translation initiation factor 5A
VFNSGLKVWYTCDFPTYILEPDLEKVRLTVQYVDRERGVVVASDDDYEEHEIPIRLVLGAEALLEPGTALGLSKDGTVPVKVSLPANILAGLRK